MKAIHTVLLAALFITISSCATSQSSKSAQSKPSKGEAPVASDTNGPNVPSCIRVMIEKYEYEEKQTPPRKIYQYTYNGKRVYYVTAPCCDFFSDLYDSECALIGHPDGGITGRGDGSLPDFMKTRSNEKLIWEDKR